MRFLQYQSIVNVLKQYCVLRHALHVVYGGYFAVVLVGTGALTASVEVRCTAKLSLSGHLS